MPKALCLTGIVISVLVFVLFLLDLLLGLIPGLSGLAPFASASKLLDVIFVACSGLLAYYSWRTLKEQD